MDTKSLMEVAQNAGINLKHDDAYHDCVEPWTKYLLETPAELADVWIDFLAEVDVAGDAFASICKHTSRANDDFAAISKKGSHVPTRLMSMAIWGDSMLSNQSLIGCTIQSILTQGAEAYVTKHAEEWYEEVCIYAGELEEGAREDWEYENSRERY